MVQSPIQEKLGNFQAYGYTNEFQDSYIKLICLRSRFLSPETGRFLTKDSWQGDYNRPGSLNRWNYVQSNPITRIDPSGFMPTCGENDMNCDGIDDYTRPANPSESPIDYLQDTQETYFTRSIESSDKDADAYIAVAGPDAPVTPLDYFIAAVDCATYLEQFEWWNKFTRGGAGYGPDAKSVVYYYRAATGIRTDDLHGIVVSHVEIYAYTTVDKVFITTKVSDRYGSVVYNKRSPSIAESLSSNIYRSSHSYHYDPQIFIPETTDQYKITIEVYFSTPIRNLKGKTVHEIDS